MRTGHVVPELSLADSGSLASSVRWTLVRDPAVESVIEELHRTMPPVVAAAGPVDVVAIIEDTRRLGGYSPFVPGAPCYDNAVKVLGWSADLSATGPGFDMISGNAAFRASISSKFIATRWKPAAAC